MSFVKGYVVLAIVLLIPTLGYFQKHYFENYLQPRLQAAALEVLKAEGVEAPSVRMVYLDAVISGRVASDAQREAVAMRVQALPGLRVPPEGNRLRTYGWLRFTRADGIMSVKGTMPPDFVIPLPASLALPSGWDSGVDRRGAVEVPRGASEWADFLDYYFDATGNRSVEFGEGRLRMAGDATVGLRSDWRSKASEVVAKDQVVDEFTLYPSIYHFPGFRPESLKEETKLASLQRLLGENVVSFGSGEAIEVPAAERGKATAVARAMLEAGPEVRYVVGGHPGSSGNVTANGELARKRARAVAALLVEHGVATEQLDTLVFGVVPEGGRDRQVEVVVK